MARGLPKSYIKKWGISKRAWKEYRKVHPKGGKKRKASGKSKPPTSKSRRSYTKRSNPSGGASTTVKERLGVMWRHGRTMLNMLAPGLSAVQPAHRGYPTEWKLKRVLFNYTGYHIDANDFNFQNAAPAWWGMGTSLVNDWFDRKTRKSAKISRGKIIHIFSESIPAIQAYNAAAGTGPDFVWNFANAYNKHTSGYSIFNHDWDGSRVSLYAGAKLGAWAYDKVIPANIKSSLNNAFPKGVNPF